MPSKEYLKENNMVNLKQNINVYIAMMMVFSVGVGASYMIISYANSTNISYFLAVDAELLAE